VLKNKEKKNITALYILNVAMSKVCLKPLNIILIKLYYMEKII
jgi:hypothetical protein